MWNIQDTFHSPTHTYTPTSLHTHRYTPTPLHTHTHRYTPTPLHTYTLPYPHIQMDTRQLPYTHIQMVGYFFLFKLNHVVIGIVSLRNTWQKDHQTKGGNRRSKPAGLAGLDALAIVSDPWRLWTFESESGCSLNADNTGKTIEATTMEWLGGT